MCGVVLHTTYNIQVVWLIKAISTINCAECWARCSLQIIGSETGTRRYIAQSEAVLSTHQGGILWILGVNQWNKIICSEISKIKNESTLWWRICFFKNYNNFATTHNFWVPTLHNNVARECAVLSNTSPRSSGSVQHGGRWSGWSWLGRGGG